MFNALICSILLLGWARQRDEMPPIREADFGLFTNRTVALIAVTLVAVMTLYTAGIRAIYGNKATGWGGANLRFGPDADWRVKPLLKSKQHA